MPRIRIVVSLFRIMLFMRQESVGTSYMSMDHHLRPFKSNDTLRLVGAEGVDV